jgi:DNA-directed RNA polymerase specialized sigma24 family protein
VTLPEFNHLYSAYSGSVFGFALNLTRDNEAAREALQEVFLRVARRPELGMPFEEARSWLFRLTHNLVIDLIAEPEHGLERWNAWPKNRSARSLRVPIPTS